MNLGGQGAKSMAAGDVSDLFPVGLRVLVVDDDPTCLMILEKMLQNCNYEGKQMLYIHIYVFCLEWDGILLRVDYLGCPKVVFLSSFKWLKLLLFSLLFFNYAD